jgi:hypothetical protein
MFLRCPKDDKGNIDFQKFEPNKKAITKFIEDLWNNPSDWSLGPKGENTLHECVKTYGGEAKWMKDRFEAIKESADEVCTMIKKYVDQKNVIKRYYYTKLLIQKAEKLLTVDKKYDLLTTTKKKNIYKKKFIAHYVAKAEGTNKNFINPWKQEPRPTYKPPKGVSHDSVTLPSGETVKPTYFGNPFKLEEQIRQEKLIEQQKELQIERGEGLSVESRSRSSSRIKSGSRRKRIRKITRKNKRKTYRRIRLF